MRVNLNIFIIYKIELYKFEKHERDQYIQMEQNHSENGENAKDKSILIPFHMLFSCICILFRLKLEAQHRRQNNAYGMEASVTKALSQFI